MIILSEKRLMIYYSTPYSTVSTVAKAVYHQTGSYESCRWLTVQNNEDEAALCIFAVTCLIAHSIFSTWHFSTSSVAWSKTSLLSNPYYVASNSLEDTVVHLSNFSLCSSFKAIQNRRRKLTSKFSCTGL